LLAFLAQRQPTAHFQGYAAQSSVNPAPGKTPPLVWCGKGEKTNTFDDAMKRFLVLDGTSHVSGRSGLLAPGKRLAERIGKANHKMVLRNAPKPYNYRA
jgi:hypothetical protein